MQPVHEISVSPKLALSPVDTIKLLDFDSKATVLVPTQYSHSHSRLSMWYQVGSTNLPILWKRPLELNSLNKAYKLRKKGPHSSRSFLVTLKTWLTRSVHSSSVKKEVNQKSYYSQLKSKKTTKSQEKSRFSQKSSAVNWWLSELTTILHKKTALTAEHKFKSARVNQKSDKVG